ncbi:uncharacterized protein LOC130202517 isoform X2 [Pseudoliparis swirei]|uniref:uncharacterized protein LOC130202517 isoform X2 n=1 Tax=Pseudoliparis swirei TaxID=2059687 RepID=UPI0024BE3D29|nr:uncharacterized protein LOC130202517 isoform X2 [Pseudoliparis swirei]
MQFKLSDGTPHDCVEIADTVTLPRVDLKDIALPEGEVWYVDGSAQKDVCGKNQVGYAVVNQEGEVISAGSLPSTYSAQAAELVALTEACKEGSGLKLTVYTDSQYAYSTLFIFAKMWEQRGMVTTTGRPVVHAPLLTDLLAAITLPKELAVVKCRAHQKGTDKITEGNAKADEEAKRAAKTPHVHTVQTTPSSPIDPAILHDAQANATTQEKATWKTRGAIEENKMLCIEGKPILPKSLFKAAAILSHGQCHVSTGGMVSMIQQYFYTINIQNYLNFFCKNMCDMHQAQPSRKPSPETRQVPAP